MKSAHLIASVLWVMLGATLCTGALQLGLGTPRDPGSGFLPFGTGMLICVLGFIQFGAVFFRKNRGGVQAPTPEAANWKRPASVIVILTAYGLLLPYLGYLVVTFLAMLGLFSLYDHQRWGLTSGGSLLVTIVTYVVFHEFLSVQLPAGLLGIGR
jgi:putative tricarboxylic transport membrane protein